jgi:hypothetical protein
MAKKGGLGQTPSSSIIRCNQEEKTRAELRYSFWIEDQVYSGVAAWGELDCCKGDRSSGDS